MDVPRFKNERELVAWLRDTPDGQQVCDEAMNPPSINVLAVQRSNCVELYAHRRVLVTTVTQVHGGTPEARRMTDELLDAQLKPYLRELHEPGHLRAVVEHRTLTPAEYEWWGAYGFNLEMLGRVGSA
jgi:hypothetical protein